jgi:hypothetical protein
MGEILTIHELPEKVRHAERVELLRAEVSADPAPFAVVRYAFDGEEQLYGLRLDLDKGSFLDSVQDEGSDRVLADLAPQVATAVSVQLTDLMNERNASQHALQAPKRERGEATSGPDCPPSVPRPAAD